MSLHDDWPHSQAGNHTPAFANHALAPGRRSEPMQLNDLREAYNQTRKLKNQNADLERQIDALRKALQLEQAKTKTAERNGQDEEFKALQASLRESEIRLREMMDKQEHTAFLMQTSNACVENALERDVHFVELSMAEQLVVPSGATPRMKFSFVHTNPALEEGDAHHGGTLSENAYGDIEKLPRFNRFFNPARHFENLLQASLAPHTTDSAVTGGAVHIFSQVKAILAAESPLAVDLAIWNKVYAHWSDNASSPARELEYKHLADRVMWSAASWGNAKTFMSHLPSGTKAFYKHVGLGYFDTLQFAQNPWGTDLFQHKITSPMGPRAWPVILACRDPERALQDPPGAKGEEGGGGEDAAFSYNGVALARFTHTRVPMFFGNRELPAGALVLHIGALTGAGNEVKAQLLVAASTVALGFGAVAAIMQPAIGDAPIYNPERYAFDYSNDMLEKYSFVARTSEKTNTPLSNEDIIGNESTRNPSSSTNPSVPRVYFKNSTGDADDNEDPHTSTADRNLPTLRPFFASFLGQGEGAYEKYTSVPTAIQTKVNADRIDNEDVVTLAHLLYTGMRFDQLEQKIFKTLGLEGNGQEAGRAFQTMLEPENLRIASLRDDKMFNSDVRETLAVIILRHLSSSTHYKHTT